MFKVLDEVCQPTIATKYSAMVDLYAREDVVIGAGETKIVPLGVKIDLELLRFSKQYDIGQIINGKFVYDHPKCLKDISSQTEWSLFLKSHYLELHTRSSLRAKGLIIGVGVIDLDYPDEIGLIVHNPIQMVFIDPIEYGDEYVDVSLTGSNYGLEEVKSCGRITIKKGDKIAQCTLVEHKGYLMGIESETERTGGFGSSGK